MGNSGTNYSVAEKSILDKFNRQTYLGNTFIVGTDINSIASTSETPIILLSNSAANNTSVFLTLKKLLCLTANQSALFKIYYDPTVTGNGTPVTPVNLKNGSSAVANASVFTSPTTSSNGTYIAALASANVDANVSDVLQIIDPGHTMLITVTLSQNNARFLSEIIFYEI